MKNLIAYSCLALFLFSCSKDEKKNDPMIFTWTHLSVSHNATTADAYISQAGLGLGPNQILANNGSATFFRVSIRLSSLNAGSYNISSVNKVDYVDDAGFNQVATTGTVTIQSNSNNRLSGLFTVTLTDPSSNNSTLTGQFSNIVVHP